MKRIAILLSFLAGFSFLQSCEEIDQPVLDMSAAVKAGITSLQTGSTITLLQDNVDDPIVIEWTAANYSNEDLANVNYILQMDLAANNFSDPRDLINTRGTSWSTTVGAMNQTLLSLELMPEEEASLSFRVLSYITRASEHTFMYSDPISVGFVPYDDFVYVKPIYMLGNATRVGWNNGTAIEMYHIKDGKFGLVDHLTAAGGQFVKFISVRGAWAPQWGTNAAGTPGSGALVYRPTESVPDPPAIPGPLEAGEYRIVADTLALTYTITKSSTTLYMLGSATTAGWDNSAALALTRTGPGVFTITTTLAAGGDNVIKFIEVPGTWAPQYGLESGTWFKGSMARRTTEGDPDPAGIPAPPTSGTYKIDVNLGSATYSLSRE
jgi:starch-binding outer membrane protein SusE/F